MITFIIALLVLVGGYFLYGSYVERVFGPDKIRKTPALTMADGVDFIPLPTWKIFINSGIVTKRGRQIYGDEQKLIEFICDNQPLG